MKQIGLIEISAIDEEKNSGYVVTEKHTNKKIFIHRRFIIDVQPGKFFVPLWIVKKFERRLQDASQS